MIETCAGPQTTVEVVKAVAQSVVAECWLNECNHAKRSQLLEDSSPPPRPLVSSPHMAPTQWSEVRRGGGGTEHSWQRLTTRHMCTFTYTNAPLYADSWLFMFVGFASCLTSIETGLVAAAGKLPPQEEKKNIQMVDGVNH